MKSVVTAVMKYVNSSAPGDDYWNVSMLLTTPTLYSCGMQYIPDVNVVFRTIQKGQYEAQQASKLNDSFCSSEDQLHARLTSNNGVYQLIAPYFEDATTRQKSGSNFADGLTATGVSYNMLSSFCDDCPVSIAMFCDGNF